MAYKPKQHGSLTGKPYSGEPLRIFSFADGIAGILMAAKKAGVPVESIVRAEVDPFANAVVDKNWVNGPKEDRVIVNNIGDAYSVSDIGPYGINLLTGGPPCQDFSRLNARGKGLYSTNGNLAQHLFALLESLPEYNRRFLMEETAAMPRAGDEAPEELRGKNYKEIINDALSERLGKRIQAFNVDARNFGPMSRDRLWWAANFPNGLVSHKQSDKEADYNLYGKTKDANTVWDPTDIINHRPKNGKEWADGLEVKDFETDREKVQHHDDDWVSQVPWAPTIEASSGHYNIYPSSINNNFASGFNRFLIRPNDKGNLIYDPSGHFKHLDRTSAPNGLNYGILNNKANNLSMIPGQAYEGRWYSPDEADILAGFPMGYTRLPKEQVAEIIDRLNKHAKGEIKDHDLDMWRSYTKHVPGVGVGNKGIISPEQTADWARIHNTGNGWQIDSVNYILRRLFGIGQYDPDWSDERLKNIVSQISKPYY